ncbi:MAG: hypothetical protein HY812_14215 [Planctomycetes bacterium]|nr:hypothetical protein [Planctomycetota bacterium]
MKESRSLPLALWVAALLSGAAALIFETLWARSLVLMLGSTVDAHTLVFAGFMLGLAVGAFACGALCERWRRVVRLYALVEIGIGVSGLAVGLLLHHHATALARYLGPLDSPARLGAAVVVVLVLVGLPTSLMGATFPLLLQAARGLGGRLGDLYGLYATNTLGGACGTLAAAVVTLPAWGVTRSLYFAAGLDLCAAGLVATLPGGLTATEPPPAREDEAPRGVLGTAAPDWLLLLSAFASGFVVLAAEVVFSRVAGFFLGNRTFAFAVLLGWILALLAAGSSLAGRMAPWTGRNVPLGLGLLWAASAALTLGSSLALFGWTRWQSAAESFLVDAGAPLVLLRVLETGLLLGPMMLAAGCVFPASLLCSAAARRRTGWAGGRFYLVNTAGGVLGSLLSGFWGVVRLGTFAWARVLVWICCGAACAFLIYASVHERRGRRRLALGLGLLGLGGAILPLGEVAGSLELGVRPGPARRTLLRREDEHGVFQVIEEPDGALSVVNNRTELVFQLGRLETSYVQQMQGHLGMAYCPQARRALVLGSGYGITAGALGLYPTLGRVDAVEIVPAMVEAADLFMPFNLGYHRNPKVHVVVGDGRHFLARASEPYDIISVNVSDPHLPGGSALFHAEFYALAQAHLRPGGVLIQHAFGTDVAIVTATLRAAFPHLVLTRAYQNGFNVVAAMQPLRIDERAVRELVDAPAVARALAGLGFLPPVDLVGMLVHGAPLDVPGAERAPLATDDFPRLELSWSGSPELWLFSNE